MNKPRQSLAMATSVVFSICALSVLPAADVGLQNGDFSTGKQFWRGDGKVVTLPDGNKVIELDSSTRRQDEIYQEIELGTLVEVEVFFRAWFFGERGQMRAKLQRPNGRSTLFAFDLPPDGQWIDISFRYQRENLNDMRSLVLETLPYDGKLQIDDVWAGATGTHPSVRPVVSTPPAPQPPKPMPAPAPTPVPAPAVPVKSVPKAASPSAFALDSLLDSLPDTIRAKLSSGELPPDTVNEINSYLAANVKGRPLEATVSVHASGVSPNSASVFRIRADDGLMSGKYPSVKAHLLWAYMPMENAAGFSQLSEGSRVAVSGTISRCDLKESPDGLRLNVDLQNSRLFEADPAVGASLETTLGNSEWSWGSGGVLKLHEDGTATHTKWKTPGTWRLIDATTLALQRPGSVPEMTVTFSNADQGGVTSHTGATTTITRIK